MTFVSAKDPPMDPPLRQLARQPAMCGSGGLVWRTFLSSPIGHLNINHYAHLVLYLLLSVNFVIVAGYRGGVC